MQIQSVRSNNINFGYDKYLNRELQDRLKQNINSPINNSIYNLNNTCNKIEDKIRFLERNRGGKGVNYQQINILTSMLAQLKLQLVLIVERLFPEINYCDRETHSYFNEYYQDDGDSIVITNKDIENACKWRKYLSYFLIGEKEKTNKESLGSSFDIYQDDGDDIEETFKLLSRKEDTNPETLVEKFRPNEYSPTSLLDVCGLDKTKEKLERSIVEPLECPKIAKQRKEDYGIDLPRFVLLYGPPGCGKTMITQAIAQETGCEMYMLDISKIGSSYVNESAKNIGTIFDYIRKKAQNSQKPIILFMDEMDSLLSSREGGSNSDKEGNKVVNTLLTQINNLKDSNIIVFGATNMPDLLDSAGKNRANVSHYIGLPSADEIVKLLEKDLSKYNMTKQILKNKEDLNEIAKQLKGYSPRTILNILSDAKEIAYETERELRKEDIIQAINSGDFEKIKERNYIPEEKKEIGFFNTK